MKRTIYLVAALAIIISICSVFISCGNSDVKEDPVITPTEEAPAPTQPPKPKIPELPGGVLSMVDNHPDARPQSGLDKADLVYEIIAEGGITRYMAMFYYEKAEKIGPVRSSRYYYAQLARGMDLPYAHAGGSLEAISTIRQIGVKDLDEINNASKYFWRDNSRKMPHNLYTSTDLLIEGAVAKKFTMKVPELMPIGESFEGEHLAGGKLNIDYAPGSRYRYVVTWIWEEGLGNSGGQYRRLINGEPHVMIGGEQLVADTIVIVEAKTKEVVKDSVVTSDVTLIGSGTALCIADNQIFRGKWEKTDVDKPLRILDEKGNELKRKDGKLWIQVVASMNNVAFSVEPIVDEPDE